MRGGTARRPGSWRTGIRTHAEHHRRMAAALAPMGSRAQQGVPPWAWTTPRHRAKKKNRGGMVSVGAKPACRKTAWDQTGRRTGGRGDMALTLHSAGKLMKGLLTEAWNSRTRSVKPLSPATLRELQAASNPHAQTYSRCYCSGYAPCVLPGRAALSAL